MSGNPRFAVFVAVALVAFVFILWVVMRHRDQRPPWRPILVTALIVVAGGMLFARLGQNAGLPWWIYYTVPLLVTILVPPWVFRMSGREVAEYLVLAFLSSPVIHVVFSFLLGWKDYMPFIEIPAMWEI